MSGIKKFFVVVLMMISSVHFVKIYAKASEGNIKCEQLIPSRLGNRINISEAIGIKPSMGSCQDSPGFNAFTGTFQDLSSDFGNQQLEKNYSRLFKKNTKVKKKNNKLSKANFQSYTGNREELILDKITFQIPSRLVANLEGYKIEFERFCSIEITPD